MQVVATNFIAVVMFLVNIFVFFINFRLKWLLLLLVVVVCKYIIHLCLLF